jgi:hypothetical protein
MYRPAHGSGTTAGAGGWKTSAGGARADPEIARDDGVACTGDRAAGKDRESGGHSQSRRGRGQRPDGVYPDNQGRERKRDHESSGSIHSERVTRGGNKQPHLRSWAGVYYSCATRGIADESI